MSDSSRNRVNRPSAADLWPDYPVDYNGPRDHTVTSGQKKNGSSSSSSTPAAVSGASGHSAPRKSADRTLSSLSRGRGRLADNKEDRRLSQNAPALSQGAKRKSDVAINNRSPKRLNRTPVPPRSSHTDGRPLSSASRQVKSPTGSEDESEMETVSVGRAIVRAENRTSTSGSVVRKSPAHRPVAYVPSPDEVRESASLIVVGEDNESSAYDDYQHKPIRTLDDFVVFDPSRGRRLVSLDSLHDEDGPSDMQWEAAGLVAPVFVDEDAAAEFEDDEDDEGSSVRQRVRLSAILRFTIDYAKPQDPIYIETEFAWYILKAPSRRYLRYFLDFYKTHKIAQAVLSSAILEPEISPKDFYRSFVGCRDNIIKDTFSKQDLKNATQGIQNALETLDEMDMIAKTPLLRNLLEQSTPLSRKRRQSPHHPHRPSQRSHPARPRVQNLDRHVLLRENQNPVCVTPRIANLAAPYFRDLVVEGYPLPRVADGVAEKTVLADRKARQFLQDLLDKTHDPPGRVKFNGQPIIKRPSHSSTGTYTRSVIIDDVIYQIGDVLITPAGDDGHKRAPELPVNADEAPQSTVGHYFWFGKILSIRMEDSTAHVQWFQHGIKTIMDDLAHPQELFITNTCDNVFLISVVGKANVKKYLPGDRPVRLDYKEFFYSLAHNQTEGSFHDIVDHDQVFRDQLPPDNCPFCLIAQQQRDDSSSSRLTENGISIGFTLHGVKYHCWDVAMIRSEKGTCYMGQIQSIIEYDDHRHSDSFKLKVRLFTRAMDLERNPGNELITAHEERHLLLTDEIMDVDSQSLLGICYVPHKRSITDLHAWLTLSPYHFFVTRICPSTRTSSWADSTVFACEDHTVCGFCMKDKLAEIKAITSFEEHVEPLRMFDPFAGVGAFGGGLAQAGCMQNTHAIEISPSAAKTLKMNSPATIVYNQCSNKVLEHAIKLSRGIDSVLHSLDDEILPPPPKAGDIDCIVAGFPCQPHSRLNMFQRADDKKSDLILNPLAWIDHLQPKFCVFENVRGFLKFNLNSTQASRYRVEGGIEMGGLKFLIRALVTLGYQVRFGLLQAAHYGTPQTRVRFFLFAAKHDYPLPQMPQPTHNFPKSDSLEIRLSNGDIISPIETGTGIAVHKFITINDAIGDLKRWDWRNPRHVYKDAQSDTEERDRNRLAIDCKQDFPWCGLDGRVPYEYPPRTPFQAYCREQAADDLQHYTRSLKAEVVERVVNIPLEAGSDYRSLRPKLWEWQVVNPVSANARRGYPAGLYGRLDAQSYFPTTVTNVEPTAKQSKVLNPWCKRVVTVRELARSQGFPDHFRFYATGDDVKTLHRQIGNAVPLPLAHALGRELRAAMFKKWQSERMAVDADD